MSALDQTPPMYEIEKNCNSNRSSDVNITMWEGKSAPLVKRFEHLEGMCDRRNADNVTGEKMKKHQAQEPGSEEFYWLRRIEASGSE